MRRGIFICIVGTDGSGKSTLASNVYTQLRKYNELHVRSVYGRHKPMVSKLLILIGRSLLLRNKNMFGDYDNYLKDKREQFHKSSRLVGCYLKLVTTEYLLQVLFKIGLPLKLGYTIIADRYVYDTVVNDLAVDQDLDNAEIKLYLTHYWKYLPKPDFVFLIKVPEDIAIARKRDIPSVSFLQIRNRLYESIFKDEDNVRILDGTMPPSELESIVIRIIEAKLKRKSS